MSHWMKIYAFSFIIITMILPKSQHNAHSVYWRLTIDVWFWLDSRYTPKPLHHQPLPLDRGEKILQNTHEWDKAKERFLTNYYHGQTRLHLVKLIEFISNQNQYRITKSIIDLRNIFPSTSPFFPGSATSIPAAQGRQRMGVRSAHQSLFLLLLRDGSPFPNPVWGPSHGRQFHMSWFSMGPSPWVCRSLPGPWSSTGFPQGHSFLWGIHLF